ncbi:MAG TPA: MFS transporter, partial [Ktedonobacterales bacterium]|nr:MFS transporter [Ktedonobacterales bacterium]
RRTMIVTNLLLAAALLPLLLVRAANLVWIVYIVAAVESALDQFFSPAQSALVPSLVAEERLVAANSLEGVSASLARLVGPALGGVIAGLLGLTAVVLFDAASFLLAALLIALIAMPRSRVVIPATPVLGAEVGVVARVWRELADGLRLIRSDRTLAVLLAAISLPALGEGVFGVLFPVFVSRVLHGGAPQIGVLMTAQAVGGLLGGLVVGLVGRRVMSRWIIGMGFALFGLLDLAIFNSPAFFPAFWLTVGLFVAVGLPGIASLTGVQSLTQATAPEAYRGRIFGVVGMMAGLLGLLGTIAAGTITDHLGVVPVLNIQGAGYVVAGLLVLLLLPRATRTRSLDETAKPKQESAVAARPS